MYGEYRENVRRRGRLRYWAGYFARLLRWLEIRSALGALRGCHKKGGGGCGRHVAVGKGLKLPASSNLEIGDHVSIQTDRIDVRAPLRIGDHVVIGDAASIITCSHDIDSPGWEFKPYGLVIEDYVWIATRAMILPSCRRIGRGAVVGAGAVVVKDVPPMAVMSGNPAKVLRYRKCVHEGLVVESLLGGDFEMYRESRKG